MTLTKINAILNKVMIGTFLSIIPLSLLTIVLPIIGYVVAIALIFLFFVTVANLITSTILFVRDINKMMENYFKHQLSNGEK